MRVLFLTHYAGLGGASQALLALIDGLKKYGVESYVLLPNEGGELQNDLEKRHVEYALLPFWAGVVNVKYLHSILTPIKPIVNLLRQIYTACRAVHYVHKWKIDIIHANSTYVTYGMILGMMTGKPNIWHLRENIEKFFDSVFFLNNFTMNRLCRHADCVAAVSDYIMQTYSSILKNHSEHCVTVYDGARVYAKKDSCAMHSPIRLVYLGGGDINKGWPELYLLYKGMKQKDFDSYTIHIPTSDSKIYREYGKNQAWEEDIWKHIIFEQSMNRKEVDEFRTEMDILIQPSFVEAFGLVTAESMLIGLPVVAVASGANLELIEDGVSGLLYRKGDAADMAEKVIRLAEDNELRQEICKNAMARAERSYSMEANCQAIYDIYESISKHRG